MANVMLWPDVHREDGHWLPAVNLARSLKVAGHTVRAMGTVDSSFVVEPYGIPFETIFESHYPFGHAAERLEKHGAVPQLHLLPMARGELDSLFTGAGKPNVLVAGYFAAVEALVLHHKYDVPVVLMSTFLREPQAMPSFNAMETLLHLPDAVRAKLIQLCAPTCGSVEEFVAPLDSVPEMITMPEEFDFSHRHWKHAGNVTYVEPMVDRVHYDTGVALQASTPEYFNDVPANKPLLLGACGSQVELFEPSARKFYDALIEMMRGPGMSGRHLILSLGRKLFDAYELEYTLNQELPSNVSLAAWVPQLEILANPLTEAVFVHGGLATVKEAIGADKPLIVAPMINDQFDNALRIEQGDLGVRISVGGLTGESMRAALAKALGSAWLHRGRRAMKDRFDELDGASPPLSVGLIEAEVA